MAFVFDMRRLHHGCGESLRVRPLKPVCRSRSDRDNNNQSAEVARNLTTRNGPGNAERSWE